MKAKTKGIKPKPKGTSLSSALTKLAKLRQATKGESAKEDSANDNDEDD